MKFFIQFIGFMRRLNTLVGIVLLLVGLALRDRWAIVSGVCFVLFGMLACPWLVKLLSR